MEYKKYFNYKTGVADKQVRLPPPEGRDDGEGAADRRDGLVYVYNEKIELAVNVALATRRPMLIRGPSGGGKSSMARNVARRLEWWYYEQVITSRTQARDLLWTFDSLRRLSDAEAKQLREDPAHYVEPGALWWAFDPETARRRGRKPDPGVEKQGPARPEKRVGPKAAKAANDPGVGPGGEGAVVLLDEIDKADPDVPNNLLVPLGSLQFKVTDIGATIEAQRPILVMITTNDERVLPSAFLRRCVVLELDPPDAPLLARIAEEHFGPDVRGIYEIVAKRVVEEAPKTAGRQGAARTSAAAGQQQPVAVPSTAEYLDTVRACIELGIDPVNDAAAWEAVSTATLWKRATPA